MRGCSTSFTKKIDDEIISVRKILIFKLTFGLKKVQNHIVEYKFMEIVYNCLGVGIRVFFIIRSSN